MDFILLVWTVIAGLIYGHLLYYFEWFHIQDYLIRVYYGYSFKRFNSFYEMSQNGFRSYELYYQPVISNLEYLQAFEGYDVEAAYDEFKRAFKKTTVGLFRQQLGIKLSLLLIGYAIFPLPLYGIGVVVGYFIFRIVLRCINRCIISTPTTILSHKFAVTACLHTYGHEKTNRLLAKQPTNDADPTIDYIHKTLFDRLVLFTSNLLKGRNWILVLLLWMCGWKLLDAIPSPINNKVIFELVGMVAAIYGLFPLLYFAYWILIRIAAESEQNQLAEDTEIVVRD